MQKFGLLWLLFLVLTESEGASLPSELPDPWDLSWSYALYEVPEGVADGVMVLCV